MYPHTLLSRHFFFFFFPAALSTTSSLSNCACGTGDFRDFPLFKLSGLSGSVMNLWSDFEGLLDHQKKIKRMKKKTRFLGQKPPNMAHPPRQTRKFEVFGSSSWV